jgi:hypothetical protein
MPFEMPLGINVFYNFCLEKSLGNVTYFELEM